MFVDVPAKVETFPATQCLGNTEIPVNYACLKLEHAKNVGSVFNPLGYPWSLSKNLTQYTNILYYVSFESQDMYMHA